jgi:aminopeptidase N
MPGMGPSTGNLTRAEAAERARLLRVRSYRIELDLHSSAASFRSLTTVRFDCARPGAESFIDLAALAVSRIDLNGERLPLTFFDAGRVRLPGLASTNELTIAARCEYSRTGEGLHRFTDPVDDSVYLYSSLETYHANKVYACFDQPDLKSTFEFTVRCPSGWQVISTMPAERAASPAGPGIESWHFPPTPPVSTYITAVIVGPYHVARGEHDGIPLGLYCRQSLASFLDPAELFEVTAQGLDYFHSVFGVRYPFAKYDQIFVPEFNCGAMENAGAVTFVEEYVFRSRVTQARHEARAQTMLHELAHMWFGNLVTMTWWDDLWLNESFATWAALVALAEVTRWPGAWTSFTQYDKAWAYRQDQLPTTHPVVADIGDVASVEVYFDGITYAKGAAVLKQLVAFAGTENFLTGLRSYFATHAWGNATLADLLTALEQASGRRFGDWSKAWLETAGVNTLRPVYTAAADGTFAEFAVLQQAAESHPVLRPHRIAIGLYDRDEGLIRRRRRLELDVAGGRTEVPELVGERVPDLVLVNDDDLTFAKIRLDERSLRTVINSVGDIADPLPAALCLAAAWDMCRDAEMPARDYVRLALSAAADIDDVNVLQTMLTQATAAVRDFADPGWREAGLALLADGLSALLTSAPPGSDKQLACAYALISVAIGAADLDLLAGLLDGSAEIDGLVVDAEMRWQVLLRLVSRGVLGRDRVEAEHASDRTDAGARQAAICLAAIPDPAAKEAAWASIISGGLPNAMFRAVLTGFRMPDQAELLEPYAARFFDVVADAWSAWGPDMAQYFAERGYPSTVITREAIEVAAKYLGREDLPGPLRRLLAEKQDDVMRALRCRERDARASQPLAV